VKITDATRPTSMQVGAVVRGRARNCWCRVSARGPCNCTVTEGWGIPAKERPPYPVTLAHTMRGGAGGGEELFLALKRAAVPATPATATTPTTNEMRRRRTRIPLSVATDLHRSRLVDVGQGETHDGADRPRR